MAGQITLNEVQIGQLIDFLRANAGTRDDYLTITTNDDGSAVIANAVATWDLGIGPAADCPGHYDDDATLTSGAGIGEATYCDGTCEVF